MSRAIDPVLMVPALLAVGSLVLVTVSDRHILPQTSSTFSLQAVKSLQWSKADEKIFDSKAEYEASSLYKTGKLQAVTASKFTRGCYGSMGLTKFDTELEDAVVSGTPDGKREWDYFHTLNRLQNGAGGNNLASVCRCIDEYSERAFKISASTVGLAHTGSIAYATTLTAGAEKMVSDQLVADMAWRKDNTAPTLRTGDTLTAYNTYFAKGKPNETFAGNYMYEMPTTQYTHLTEIVEWCDQTALPQYTLEFQSVIYSKAMLIVGLALVFAGLDVFGTRSLEHGSDKTATNAFAPLLFLFEVIPVAGFTFVFFRKQWTGHIQDDGDAASSKNLTFLVIVIMMLCMASALLLVGVSLYYIFANDVKKRTVTYKLTQRIYTDVPMIAGLALVGVALKLQNGEHDEVILLNTLLVLVSAGLVQHLSSLVKIMYERLCGLLSNQVLDELQGASPVMESDENKESHDTQLDNTRRILQYFGWTRLYGFGVVVLFVAVTVTMSSSVTPTNPINSFTQNQYYYFAFAFIMAWTGLDFIYEILPFTSNKPDSYSEASVDKMRKISVLLYILFVMISQYTLESGEF